jgi:hypothetical protein
VSSTPFPWWAKLGLIAFGLSIGLVGAEIGTRILNAPKAGSEFESLDDLRKAMLKQDKVDDAGDVSLRSIITPHANDKIIYDLRENLKVRFQGVPVTTSSCGMRNREISVVKPPGVYRIAMLGDSFTFGWGVDQEKIFPQVLEDDLNRASGGHPRFEVLNFGVPGYATYQEVELFKEKALDFDPDAVLVFFIDNDFQLPFYVKDVYRPGQILCSSSFLRLGMKAIDPKLEDQRMEMLGYDPNTALKELAEITKERGIKVGLTINPKKGWDRLYNKLWTVKQGRDIQFINLYYDMERMISERNINKRDLTLPTDPHPSALKHRLLGDLLAPYFMEAIL